MSIIVLNATTKSIEALLEGAVAANQPEFSAHYADANSSAFTEGENDGLLNSTTAVTLVAAPTASARRIVREIVIYNADTSAVTVTIRINNGGSFRRIQKVTLAAGTTWKLSDGTGGTSSSGYDLAGDIHGATNKTTPVDADEVGIWDSVSGLLNRLSWANIKAGIISRILASVTDGQYLLRSGSDIIGGTPAGGGGMDWVSASGTWSYSSADAPVFVASVNADMTAILYPGYRVSLTQTTEKFFIVHAVGAFSGGATLVTIYGGTDYTLANAAITAPKYSNAKCPPRFPLDPNKWTVVVSDTTDRSQASPTQNTWYNLGGKYIDLPIGIWKKVTYSMLPYSYRIGSSEKIQTEFTLSTSSNSVSDASMNGAQYSGLLGSNAELGLSVRIERPLPLVLAVKTRYYILTRTIATNISSLNNQNATQTLYILAEDAYL